MKKENSEMVLEQTRSVINDCLTSEKLRLKETAFTRKRRLGAIRLLHIILSRIYLALQLHLDNFFESRGELSVSKQAFSKARKGLNPEYVRSFFDHTAVIAAQDETLDAYQGMRLIAIDGSDVALTHLSAKSHLNQAGQGF